MKIATIFAAGALAAGGIALTPAPAEARTYVSIGFGSPGYGSGYYRGYRGGYYGRPYYNGYYGAPYGYYDRRDYRRSRHYRQARIVCRYDRWGRERCRRARW